ncbi:MAG: M23 family metallopeptidase [Actinobacteria bacterium]|nr:M23 family metallopeptidase [Actinomycetota bacterium]MCL5883390.1 M23 family metallopeptidase [Actinomycetota bacterium]
MMWKRIVGSIVALFIFNVTGPFMTSALAVCAVDPPIPADGLAWPASGPVVNSWSLDCARDSGHRGIDIDVPSGAQITASAGGAVIFTGYTPGESGGTTVSIEHPGGLRTTYLHLTALEVSEGQYVAKGQPLGKSDGRPLHFGLKIAGARERYFNPADYLPAIAAGASEPGQTAPDEAPIETPVVPEPAGPADGYASVTAPAAAPAETSAKESPAATAPALAATQVSDASPVATPTPSRTSNRDTTVLGAQSVRAVPALPSFSRETAPFQHAVLEPGGESVHQWTPSSGAARTPLYAVALAGGVLLIVFAGGGMGRMAGNPASC